MSILQAPVRMLGMMVNAFARGAASGGRLFAVLDMDPEIKESKNAKGWEDFRKNKSRKAAGISKDRLKKIKENLKKKNYRYIIEGNIYRTSKGQEIWMKLGFPYIGKETTIPNSQLRQYLVEFLYEHYGEKGS